MLANIAAGLGYGNPNFGRKIQRAWMLLRSWKLYRLFHNNYLHQECRQISSSFQDAFNQTLLAYAGYNKQEAKSSDNLKQLLDGNFRLMFDRRLHKPMYFQHRATFRRRLKMLAINFGMTFEPKVLQELLEKVKEPMDNHYHRLNHSGLTPGARYKTCAVVGNSGEILNTTRGSFIDSHEMVIRINNAKARVFAQSLADFIGSKTTLMFMNSHILHQCSRNWKCSCHPYGSEVPIMLYLINMEHVLDVTYCGKEHTAPLFLTDRRFDMLVEKIGRWYSIKRFIVKGIAQKLAERRHWELFKQWEIVHRKDYHYSSGLQAVVLALGLCEQVHLFGFGKSPKFQHHFHTKQRAEHYSHDYEAEYSFYYDLEKKSIDANPFLCQTATPIPPVHVFR
ncbi:hypothetical protein Mapa_003382 [Marchantia paleacea]|nr:hypothetical protein Mapa_003382 [Marchantia paleacea]